MCGRRDRKELEGEAIGPDSKTAHARALPVQAVRRPAGAHREAACIETGAPGRRRRHQTVESTVKHRIETAERTPRRRRTSAQEPQERAGRPARQQARRPERSPAEAGKTLKARKTATRLLLTMGWAGWLAACGATDDLSNEDCLLPFVQVETKARAHQGIVRQFETTTLPAPGPT